MPAGRPSRTAGWRGAAATRWRGPAGHRIPTFRAASETVGAAGGWRGSTQKNREAALVRYCDGILDKGVDRVGREDVLKIVSPVYAEKPATGRRLRGWIRGVLAWAQAHGHVEVNVAGECIDGGTVVGAEGETTRGFLPSGRRSRRRLSHPHL